jgi:fatty-acyl-CoA synthase
MYTSGTTGKPKGAMLSNGNLWWNNVNALLTMDFLQEDVSLNSAPLFHIGGLNVTTLGTLMKGGHVVLHKQFDPAAFLRDVPRYGVTTHFAVPAMLLFLSNDPAFGSADLSSIRMIVVGGAPVPESLLRLYTERGIVVLQGYGLTETAPMVTFLTPERALEKVGSAGKPPLLTDVRLTDGEGSVVTEPAARGEVCVRGPNIMAGYWRAPDATAEVMEDGWFHTGDVGYFDAEGFLYICDRVKDMVISGGENVYPAEVESVLYGHPSIAEVAVIGVPDATWGETLVAVVALRPGAELSLAELEAFAEPQLANFKIPRRLAFVEALPRNTTGKVLKFDLRATYARGGFHAAPKT